ncbi:MAG TPA: SDR family oxidoreductase [Myxococcota bacterium]|nr:SDR family oxidoreductase [Myxococcota bacterium]
MRTVVITGANAGLGYQTASQLARMGAHIVMACRNLEKAKRARSDLLAELPAAEVTILPLDVSDTASIREFGRQLEEQVGELDVLIHNAGVVALPLTRNHVGHELQLVTNYLGAFELTGTLLPLFPDDAPARIVNVGSLAHRFARLDLDDLNWEKTSYNEWKAYARSKLALVTFTLELDRRLRQRGSHIIALGAHPGFAATDIGRHHSLVNPRNPIGRWFNRKLETWLIPTPAQAAMSIVHAASSEDVKGGEYYGPTGFLEIGGRPGRARVNPMARDVEIGSRLWAASESMIGMRYLSSPGCFPGAAEIV